MANKQETNIHGIDQELIHEDFQYQITVNRCGVWSEDEMTL